MGRPADRRGRDGRGDVEAALLHQRDEARLANPLLLARQVGSVANLTNNRFGFGVGIGWAPEEFEWCGVPYAKRGKRVDEMIEVIKLVLGRRHGRIPRRVLRFRPAADEPRAERAGAVLRRRAHRRGAEAGGPDRRRLDQRDDDRATELAETIGKLKTLLAENGRADEPFEYQAVCIDKFGVDGHRDLAAGRRHRQHRHPVGVRRPRLRRADREEEGFAEAVRRHLYPLGLAGLMTRLDPVHLAGKRSREAAIARDKEAWLAVFADDAIVEDPIGPSHFDPEGKGHRGKEAIAAFYDMAIAPSELKFNFIKTYQCGNEEANVGNIVIRRRLRGHRRGRVHLPGQRRRQDRRAAGLLGARPGHRSARKL